MANWYMAGQSNYDNSTGFHMGFYLDYDGFPEGDYGSQRMPNDVESLDPFMTFGAKTDPWLLGKRQVEIGLWGSNRIRIDESGIWGFDGDSSGWVDLLTGGGGSGVVANYIHLQDSKASGGAGGDFTQDAWRTHVITTEVTDEPGACSLASNQFTLDAGTYIISAWSTAHKVNRHKSKLYNITDAADELVGSNTFAGSGDNVHSNTWIKGVFTIAAQKVFELQCYCQTTRGSDGFGSAQTRGIIEIYADIELWKVD